MHQQETKTATMNTTFPCPHCNKVCKTDRGLKQHINKRKECREAQVRLLVADRSVKTVANLGDDDDPIPSHKGGENRRSARLEGKASQDADVALDGAQSVASENSDPQPIGSDPGAEPSDGDSTIHNEEAEDGSAVFDIPSNDEETDDDKDLDQFTPELMPNLDMLSGFQAHCDTHSHYFLPLTRSDRTSICLLDSPKHKKAP